MKVVLRIDFMLNTSNCHVTAHKGKIIKNHTSNLLYFTSRKTCIFQTRTRKTDQNKLSYKYATNVL